MKPCKRVIRLLMYFVVGRENGEGKSAPLLTAYISYIHLSLQTFYLTSACYQVIFLSFFRTFLYGLSD